MKKINFLSLLAFSLPLSLSSCNLNTSLNDNVKIEVKEMYDYFAISGINMLNSSFTSLKMAKMTDDEKNEILDNLKIVENIISEGIVKSDEMPSDKEEYETMYTISTTNIDGSNDLYTFYYNETLNSIEDDEQESIMEGIVIIDDVTYQMIGEKEIEDNESELTYKISLDENNYVIINHEYENDESEYEYSHYKNNKKVQELSLEIEKKVNGKLEFEFSEKTSQSKKEYKYEFVNIDDEEYVFVKIKENNSTVKVKILIEKLEDGLINYIFVE